MTEKNRTSKSTRRDFLKEVAGTTAAAGAVSAIAAHPALAASAQPQTATVSRSSRQASGVGRIRLQDNRLQVETGTLTAVIDKGFITSLKSKASGEEFIKPFDVNQSAALQLLYPSAEVVGLDESKFGNITSRVLSDDRAEVIFHSWDADGVLGITADPETGDLVVEPGAYSSRPGVAACRWNLRGLREDCDLVAPFYHGVRLKLDDPLIRDSRWTWPLSWQAGLGILQARSGGFWVHTQDDSYRYKSLKVGNKTDAYVLGMDSEAYGPLDNNLSAGGIAWRINVYQGDWKVPAASYRDWLWRAYNLQAQERRRPEWLYGLKFALSWCPSDPEILDAVAKRFDPRTVLIHIPQWRTDPYDENYPTYVASESTKALLAKGQAMGFHIAPHFNAVDMDPMHPVYELLRDFQYRDLERKTIAGWVSERYNKLRLAVPESNNNRRGHREKKVMVKIHPGLGMWRSILGENIAKAVNDLSLDTVFVDVTLYTPNIHNCLVESTTPTEGMKLLLNHVASSKRGLAVGGEGHNEIIMQEQSFGQAQLFPVDRKDLDGLKRTGGCPLNEFLFGKLSRTTGYAGLAGRNPDDQLRIQIYEQHGSIPSLAIRSAKELTDPNPFVKDFLKRIGAR
jgi:hypothetical protein